MWIKKLGCMIWRKKVKCNKAGGKLVAELTSITSKKELAEAENYYSSNILEGRNGQETNTIRNRILLAMTIDQVNIHDIYDLWRPVILKMPKAYFT
jgi:hypothetical protein